MSTIRGMSKDEINKEPCERLEIQWHKIIDRFDLIAAVCLCGATGIAGEVIKHCNENNLDFYSDSGKIELLREMEKRKDWRSFIGSLDRAGLISAIIENYLLDFKAGLLAKTALEWLRKEQR